MSRSAASLSAATQKLNFFLPSHVTALPGAGDRLVICFQKLQKLRFATYAIMLCVALAAVFTAQVMPMHHEASWPACQQPCSYARYGVPLQSWCAVASSPCASADCRPGNGSTASPPPRMRLSPGMPRFLPSAGLLATGAQVSRQGFYHPRYEHGPVVHSIHRCLCML